MTQFLCCIPLSAVEQVLAWLKPHLPLQQHTALLSEVKFTSDDICSAACANSCWRCSLITHWRSARCGRPGSAGAASRSG